MDLPEDRALAELVQRYAGLIERFGSDIGRRPLVLPNSQFFPDVFTGDQGSVARLLRRMQLHAGMSDVPIAVGLDVSDGEAQACGSGGCGSCAVPVAESGSGARLLDLGDEWRIELTPDGARHPVALTAGLARLLGCVFLLEESSAERPIDEPVDVTAELTAVALGLGSLLLAGSYVYQKSCGGPSVARLTLLSVGELAALLAMFASSQQHSLRVARSELDATQREALVEAETWLLSNPRVAKLLVTDPLRLALGDFELSAPKSWLARMFSQLSPAARASNV
jgi:hypothetical protein